MSPESTDHLAAGAVVALLLISLAAIIGGIYAAVINEREIEGVVAIVSGAVAGIVALVLRDNAKQ